MRVIVTALASRRIGIVDSLAKRIAAHVGARNDRSDSNDMDMHTPYAMVACMQKLILHSCGHEQDHYVIGEYAADCDRQVVRLTRQKCRRCSAEATDAKASQEKTAIMGLALVALQGSGKQIAWAETIRAKRLATLQRRDVQAARIPARFADAKWWIEQRSASDAIFVAAASVYVEA